MLWTKVALALEGFMWLKGGSSVAQHKCVSPARESRETLTQSISAGRNVACLLSQEVFVLISFFKTKATIKATVYCKDCHTSL